MKILYPKFKICWDAHAFKIPPTQFSTRDPYRQSVSVCVCISHPRDWTSLPEKEHDFFTLPPPSGCTWNAIC